MSLVLSQQEILTSPDVGAKARVLAEVAEQIGHVPAFVAIPTTLVDLLWQAEEDDRALLLGQIQTEIRALLPGVERVAIRSAARAEDQAQSSHAGQFYTAIDISWEVFIESLWKVVQIGVLRTKGATGQFSCFVQQYIEADIAGVTFTRGPEGDPRLWLEYHAGRGEALVSGQIQPTSCKRFWGEVTPLALPGGADTHALLLAWKDLEAIYEHPQDIEWCLADGEWYLLQARPITTITAEVYQGLLEADTVLPVQAPFWYEQTEICELAPHPCQATLSLLERLYDANGPIAAVYRSLGVTYYQRDFLCVVAGQLYVDREEELKTLFPEYTILTSAATGVAKQRSFLGMIRASFRQRHLRNSQIPAPIQLQQLEEGLRIAIPTTTIEVCLQAFLQVYQTIFQTNLATQQSKGQVYPILARAKIGEISLLQSAFAQSFRLDLKKIASHCDLNWQGNGLDLADDSKFVMSVTSLVQTKNEADRWWDELAPLSRTAYEPVIRAMIQGDQLREVGRWVTVRWIDALRRVVMQTGAGQGFSEAESLQMLFDEWLGELPDQTALEERLEEYKRTALYHLPGRLTNLPEPPTVVQGLSSGIVEGVICQRETIIPDSEGILWTEQLSPELAPLLSQVKGIVSARGGMLSHLAILAREQHVPVVSGVDLGGLGLVMGERIRMNGATGQIERLS